MHKPVAILAMVLVLTAVPITAMSQQNDEWIEILPGVGFESLVCDYTLCWIQFAMPVYVKEIWQYSDGHIWLWGLYIPGYTPKPYNLGIGVWNGNATIVLVTHNLIRIIVDAPTGARSTLILYGVAPYRIKLNGIDVTPRSAPSLEALNKSSLAWLHDGHALYLRAEHSSPLIWDIELSETPESEPTTTQTPVAILPYYTETTTPIETITITQEAYNTIMILAIIATTLIAVAGLIYHRGRT